MRRVPTTKRQCFSWASASTPSKPFPGQRRPPCVRGEREIHGACWLGPVEGQEPPCGDQMFDHEAKCYFASFDQSPQPTS
jgi:hypothetical protein